MTDKPAPGSAAAYAIGCTCPVLDNCHGAGIPWPREDGLDPVEHPSFWINEDCPLHGTSPTSEVSDKELDRLRRDAERPSL